MGVGWGMGRGQERTASRPRVAGSSSVSSTALMHSPSMQHPVTGVLASLPTCGLIEKSRWVLCPLSHLRTVVSCLLQQVLICSIVQDCKGWLGREISPTQCSRVHSRPLKC